jgi:hypothetical protein
MLIMAVLAITMFVGITLLAQAYRIVPSETETVILAVGARSVWRTRPCRTTSSRWRRC